MPPIITPSRGLCPQHAAEHVNDPNFRRIHHGQSALYIPGPATLAGVIWLGPHGKVLGGLRFKHLVLVPAGAGVGVRRGTARRTCCQKDT